MAALVCSSVRNTVEYFTAAWKCQCSQYIYLLYCGGGQINRINGRIRVFKKTDLECQAIGSIGAKGRDVAVMGPGGTSWPAETLDPLLCFLLHACDVANQVPA